MAKKLQKTKFIGQVTKIKQTEPQTVIEWPRTLTHIHTYGLLSPFFRGLKEGRLKATYCPDKKCPGNLLWIPPRAHCPDCHTEMKWKTLRNPVIGRVYAFTEGVYAGPGIEHELLSSIYPQGRLLEIVCLDEGHPFGHDHSVCGC